MKKEQILNFLKSKDIWFWIAAAMLMALLAFVLHDCAYALAAVIPTASGRIISGTPLTTAQAAAIGQAVRIRMKDGILQAEVTGKAVFADGEKETNL